MKKLLGIVVLGLLWCNISIAETVNERLSKIEKRLDKIEKLLQPLSELQDLTTSKSQNETTKKSKLSSEDKTLSMKECLKVTDQKLSIIESNSVYVQYAWIIDYTNSCDKDFVGYPVLEFLDESGFLLDELSYPDQILVPANGTAQAKGSKMIDPVSKANRITHTSAGFSTSNW